MNNTERLSRLALLLQTWKTDSEKHLMESDNGPLAEYWKGQLSIINQLLQIFEIFK